MASNYVDLASRQTVTAKSAPDASSRVDFGDLSDKARFVLALEPGRTGDVTLVNASGGELRIPQNAGGDGHYPTLTLLVAHGPWDFKADADTNVSFTLCTVFP